MGFYQEELLPRLQDKVMARKPNRAVRARVFDQGGDRVHSRRSRPQWRRSVLSSCYSFPSGELVSGGRGEARSSCAGSSTGGRQVLLGAAHGVSR
jgi:hypothetical protein